MSSLPPLNVWASESELEQRCTQYIEEVMKSPKEYTTYKLEELQKSLREELMKLLRRYDVRPVQIVDYHYGFSTRLEANKRLIVLEKGDRTKCREYSAYRTYDQFCLQCRSLSNHKVLIYSKLIHGILFVPVNHICEPREYDLVMGVQEKLEEGDTKAALRLQKKYAVKKHPKFLDEMTPKQLKTSSTSGCLLKLSKYVKDTVATPTSKTNEDSDKMNLNNDESVIRDGSVDSSFTICSQLLALISADLVSPPVLSVDVNKNESEKLAVSPRFNRPEDSLGKPSTSNITFFNAFELDRIEDAVADNDVNQKNPRVSSSAHDPAASTPLKDPSQLSSLLTGGGGRGNGRKRGSKTLVIPKYSLDLIDSIKSLLPQEDESSSAPKKQRRRRKPSIEADLDASTIDNDNIDLFPTTNATATILDMIDMELNKVKFASENSSTTDAEHTDDCEAV